jgi:hypothetical protein
MSNTVDIRMDPNTTGADLPPEVAFVRTAMRDLRRSLVRLPPGLSDRWFPTAFNDWYCPAVRRGYIGGMGPVFDVGVMLMEPTAELVQEDGHGTLLRWIKEREFLGELARRAVSGRVSASGSGEVRSLVTWTMIEPLLRCLLGVWNSAAIAAGSGRELPSIERRLNEIHIHAGAYEATPVYKLDIGSIDRPDTSGGDNASELAGVIEDATRRVTGCVLPTVEALGVRLFAARIAGLLPELVHKLDHELVEACLLGPLLKARDHEPPRRSPTDVSNSRQSKQPGAIAGVTRVETKRPNDPVTDVLPSELMILRRSRKAGLANILYGRPLVLVHERELDVAPKHRALVCYIVDAHQNVLSSRRAMSTEHAGGCAYRDGYVYAKRQLFDTLHDLADAQALALLTADVQIEAAVFAIPPGRENAVVHRRIPLDGLKRGGTGDRRIDRLIEMVTIAELIPRFFIRYVDERDRSSALGAGTAVDVLPSDVAGYLRHTAQRGRFRIIHLVLVALDNASRLMERLHRYLQYQSFTPIQVTIMGVDLDANDSDARLVGLHEPAWTFAETGSLRDAIALDAGRLETMPLAELRARFVESIFGKEVEPTAAQLSRIRID